MIGGREAGGVRCAAPGGDTPINPAVHTCLFRHAVHRPGLPSATAVALRKLVDVRMVIEDRQRSSYTVIENVFREAIRMESRVAGDRGGDGAEAYFRRGRITAIPGEPDVRSRVLSVVADVFDPGETYPRSRSTLCAQSGSTTGSRCAGRSSTRACWIAT